MDDILLLEKIKKLPPLKKEEIENHLNKLLSNNDEGNKDKKTVFGFAKGAFKMLPGFDDPIEGSEEYM